MYKLVALDVDGTLLNSNGEISAKTLDAINECVDNGVLVTISSGRPIQGIEKLIDLLNIEIPVITYNGAMIVDSKSKDILFEKELNEDDARDIIKLGLKYNTTLIIWSKNKLYVNTINSQVNEYKKISGLTPIVLEDFEEVIMEGITKILWIDEVDKIVKYKRMLRGNVSNDVTYCASKANYLVFFDNSVSKGEALKFIGQKLNIDKNEMIAFGDAENDLSMIEYAGLGVAMGNAVNQVKEIADVVTLSNDEDGIYKVIDEFVLQNNK